MLQNRQQQDPKRTTEEEERGTSRLCWSLFTCFYLSSNFTDFRMTKAIWVLWDRADKPLNHKLTKYDFYHKLVSLLGYHKKVLTSTVCMFKLYLPHVEDWECTIKDHLQNQGNWYSRHANYMHYSYTSLTALSLMQLQAASKECKNKNQSERHGSLKKQF